MLMKNMSHNLLNIYEKNDTLSQGMKILLYLSTQ